jgi:putative exporter of polyketide antibiotics
LGESIIPQSEYAKSRLYLLGSDLQLSIRQNISTFFWWCLGALTFSGLLAAIAKVGADALASSPAFATVITKLGGSYNDLVVAFIGFGGLFTALILLVMAAVCFGSIRQDESKGYLDNFLIQPVKRTSWLTKRLIILILMTGIIALLSNYLVWQIASAQGVSLDLWIMLQNAIALTGTVFLLVGIGAVFYGMLPRIAVISMYAVIIWAFIVDVLKSFFSLGDFIDKTSLLHYVSFAPTKAPDWSTFAWLVGLSIIMVCIGVWAFSQRDIVSE